MLAEMSAHPKAEIGSLIRSSLVAEWPQKWRSHVSYPTTRPKPRPRPRHSANPRLPTPRGHGRPTHLDSCPSPAALPIPNRPMTTQTLRLGELGPVRELVSQVRSWFIHTPLHATRKHGGCDTPT